MPLAGLMVTRLDIILVFPVAAGIYVNAVLDPFADGLGLRMTQEMADNLGTGQGELLTYRIAQHVFAANVIVEEAPDQARAMQLAQQQAAAAKQRLGQDQLARRAEAIMAERQRRVVVPAGALQQLLRAGVSIIMH
ncbi:hypothetical protein COHA_002975 [Chlorella ohadii]|uniref:Uncharacterized protein n=1 Tax=Chlorella ohadii TaxID=2649997 RepID=A0AAD5DSA1_9CHLO|nr:hypothetical protein COHA_002975 [Chlorella ohadii]